MNPEFNGGVYGDDYLGGTLNLDVGYEVSDGPYSFYIQGGPAIVMPDGVDSEVELAGKFGGSVAVSEKASVYAELSGMTGDELSIGSSAWHEVHLLIKPKLQRRFYPFWFSHSRRGFFLPCKSFST